MAIKITEDCVACGACEPECPNKAISEGDPIYIINSDLCTECVGAFDSPQCASVCPVDCCVPDPEHQETKDALMEKYRRTHAK